MLYLSIGESKHKREGPCVGTKGFRAPEVRNFDCHHFAATLLLYAFTLLYSILEICCIIKIILLSLTSNEQKGSPIEKLKFIYPLSTCEYQKFGWS